VHDGVIDGLLEIAVQAIRPAYRQRKPSVVLAVITTS
jgi:hypothetical protein